MLRQKWLEEMEAGMGQVREALDQLQAEPR